MDNADKGQVSSSAAEIYEAFFVPALFQEWPPEVAADLQAGQKVLDVACGTGVLAHTAARIVGASGEVTGLDINEGMLAVARSKSSDITWKQGRAEDLPFEDNIFDAVVSQFGLMFFEDREAALMEMVRVLKPGGYLAVAVWNSLDNTPGYASMFALLQRMFGDEVANSLRYPFILGDTEALKALFDGIGLNEITVKTIDKPARFPSLQAWVYTEIKGWVLSDVLTDEQTTQLVNEAEKELATYVVDDGTVRFSAPAHIVSGVKA